MKVQTISLQRDIDRSAPRIAQDGLSPQEASMADDWGAKKDLSGRFLPNGRFLKGVPSRLQA